LKLKTIDIDSALKFFGEELKRRLKDRLVKIILFGSYAKGLADVDSDVDVLIIHSHPDPDKAFEIMADAALIKVPERLGKNNTLEMNREIHLE